MGLTVTGQKHTEENGMLQIKNADWEEGKLDFSFTFNDRNTTEVMIRMKYGNGFIYLDSFKAVSVARDFVDKTLSVVEYKIPEYSYKMQVPILMKGLKSEEAKSRDDMEKSLNNED